MFLSAIYGPGYFTFKGHHKIREHAYIEFLNALLMYVNTSLDLLVYVFGATLSTFYIYIDISLIRRLRLNFKQYMHFNAKQFIQTLNFNKLLYIVSLLIELS